MPKWLRDHGLSIVLSTILVAFMAVSFVFGIWQYSAEQPPFEWSGFMVWWVYETVTSLEADVFGAIVLVVFTKYLFEKHSAEAPPPEEQK